MAPTLALGSRYHLNERAVTDDFFLDVAIRST